ncbi:MAG: glycosyltransferase family A protein [Coriobacteriia bacterium]|nr:glycosyltransferase family A protein [Coriobacteriia bacterium]
MGAAVESVLGQSHGNLELIVVDDGSTDGTGDVVESMLRRDGRLRYLRLETNGGAYVARNAGLMLARGEFLTCHDSDDWSHPWKLERQLRPLLADGNLVCSTSSWVRIQDDGEYYARPVHPLTRMNPSSPMFRRALLSRVGVWDEVRTGADSEFLARMGLHVGARAMYRVKEPLTLGSHRAGSLMTGEETGYGPEGISPRRLAEWEAWTWWHISELRAGRKPVMGSTGRGKGRIVGVPFGEVGEE